MTKTSFIKRLTLSFTGALLMLLFASSAVAQAKQDFELHNKTGKEIKEVYVSPHTADDWEEDILGDDVLPHDESVDITFSRKVKADHWDIKVVFSDGKNSVWKKLNLSQITDVTLSYRDGKPWATWKNGG